MQWIVEILSLSKSAAPAQRINVEANNWEDAFMLTRKYAGLAQTLTDISIDIRTDGMHIVDPNARLRYRLQPQTQQDSQPSTVRQGQKRHKVQPKRSRSSEPEGTTTAELTAEPVKSFRHGLAGKAKGDQSPVSTTKAASKDRATTSSPVSKPSVLISASMIISPPTTSAVTSKPSGGSLPPEPLPLIRVKQNTQPESQPQPSAPASDATPLPSPQSRKVTELSQREEQPSDTSPMIYREYAYAITPKCTECEAQELILDKLKHIQHELASLQGPKLVNLAVFDHVFSKRPQRAPLVTLVWKDWKGEAELHYPARPGASMPPAALRGNDKEIPPSNGNKSDYQHDAPSVDTSTCASATEHPLSATRDIALPVETTSDNDADTSMRPFPLLSDSAKAQARLKAKSASCVSAPTQDYKEQSQSDAAEEKDEGAPSVSHEVQDQLPSEAPVAVFNSPLTNPPTDTRQDTQSDNEIIADIFDAMHDLFFRHDAYDAAEFVVSLGLNVMNCDLGMVQLYDINRAEFVVIHAVGPLAKNALGHRTPDRDPSIAEITSKQAPTVINTMLDPRTQTGRWHKLGIVPSSVLACVVADSDRIVGILELARESRKSTFRKIHRDAICYMAESYGDFIGKTGVPFSMLFE